MITVCVATYNGARHIGRQLSSILEELSATDEVIIVDDASTDQTREIVGRIGDPRVALHVNDRNRGEVFSFGRAMSLAKGDVLFLSDQDDIWIPGRVALMRRTLDESEASVIASNFDWMADDESRIEVHYDGVASSRSADYVGNIRDIFLGRTNYYGCAMALRRSFLPVVLPIPTFVESHDLWIAIAANLARSNVHMDERTLRKRKHSTNVTSTISSRPLWRKLRSRLIFCLSMAVLLQRIRSRRS